jgi:hypothetical protein
VQRGSDLLLRRASGSWHAVRVEFQGDNGKESLLHYFAEEELVIVKEDAKETSNSNNEEV